MEIIYKSAGDIKIVPLKGSIDAYSSKDVKNSINALIDEGSVRIVVNFDDVDYISSSGLRVMLASLKRLKEVQGDLKLACLKPHLKDVFDIAGFTPLFEIYSREDEAISSFNRA